MLNCNPLACRSPRQAYTKYQHTPYTVNQGVAESEVELSRRLTRVAARASQGATKAVHNIAADDAKYPFRATNARA